MPTHHLDHANLSRMAGSGRINATHIVGQPGGWAIQVDINHQEHVLTAQRSGNLVDTPEQRKSWLGPIM